MRSAFRLAAPSTPLQLTVGGKDNLSYPVWRPLEDPTLIFARYSRMQRQNQELGTVAKWSCGLEQKTEFANFIPTRKED